MAGLFACSNEWTPAAGFHMENSATIALLTTSTCTVKPKNESGERADDSHLLFG